MPRVMMRLGDHSFSLSAESYNSLQNSSRYIWARQSRLGRRPGLQFVGQGDETVGLRGVIYAPESDPAVIDRLKEEAGKGKALRMVSGIGKVLGLWAVEQVDVEKTLFIDNGASRRVEFSIRLAYYGDTNASV